MKHITIRLFFICLLAFQLLACRNRDLPNLSKIEIIWEVESNSYQDFPATRSAFTFINNSSKALTASGWELYFNLSPRDILNGDNEVAVVERVSGDWFKMYPKSNFLLKPGEKVRIVYETNYWLIKESDGPNGLYFALTDKEGRKSTVEVKNYSIVPFERPEQIHRHKIDYEPLPSSQNDFEANKHLFKIPENQLLKIIPTPISLVTENGKAKLSDSLTIFFMDSSLREEANYLKTQFVNLLGWTVLFQNDPEIMPSTNLVFLNVKDSKSGSREGYELSIDNDNTVSITGPSKAAVFYGIQSFLALLPVRDILAKSKSLELPLIKVIDQPRFAYRGVHIDVARNFLRKENIKKTIDILAFYKINTLHLHLTDDEGWRIEIATLPELTAVGGKREHTGKDSNGLHPAYGSGPKAFANGTFGSGFYSRADFIEILRYANLHHIKVIPEINLPGHARAAIKAMEARYQHFIKMGDVEAANMYRLVDPDEKSVYKSAQYYNDNVVNVARESTYRFFETVLDEIIGMYDEANAPFDILHIGGDEVPKGAWTKSPLVELLLKELTDIKHYENLHSYFTERALEIMTKKNLKMAGWEEIALHTDNGQAVNPKFANGNVIPYVWNSLWGAQDLAYRLANRGYPVVMCHVTNFYLDMAYSNDPKEPGLYWGGFGNTFSAWHYNPYNLFYSTIKDNLGKPVDIDKEYKTMERLKPKYMSNIIGVQAQLWSETVKGQSMMEYMLLPKLIGFAETAWAKQREWETTVSTGIRANQVAKDWNIFANSITQNELPRLSTLFGGFNYRIPPPGAKFENGFLHANVEFPGLEIRYSTNGDEPTINSSIYTKPVKVSDSIIHIKSFDIAGRGSRTVILKTN